MKVESLNHNQAIRLLRLVWQTIEANNDKQAKMEDLLRVFFPGMPAFCCLIEINDRAETSEDIEENLKGLKHKIRKQKELGKMFIAIGKALCEKFGEEELEGIANKCSKKRRKNEVVSHGVVTWADSPTTWASAGDVIYVNGGNE